MNLLDPECERPVPPKTHSSYHVVSSSHYHLSFLFLSFLYLTREHLDASQTVHKYLPLLYTTCTTRNSSATCPTTFLPARPMSVSSAWKCIFQRGASQRTTSRCLTACQRASTRLAWVRSTWLSQMTSGYTPQLTFSCHVLSHIFLSRWTRAAKLATMKDSSLTSQGRRQLCSSHR